MKKGRVYNCSETDTDFEVETRFESALVERFQTQGITVEQDYDTLIRCEYFQDGSGVYMYVTFLDNGTNTDHIFIGPLSLQSAA